MSRTPALSASERVLRARIGAYALHAQRDARETTARARAAFLDRFEREVDPDRRLPAEERAKRAAAARKSYFTRLALASVRRRRLTRTRSGRGLAAPLSAQHGEALA